MVCIYDEANAVNGDDHTEDKLLSFFDVTK